MNVLRTHRLPLLGVLCLAACAASAPKPEPLSLKAPPPPDPVAGSIRVYGDHLAAARADALRKRLRAAEREILEQYQTALQHDSLTEGSLQLRLGVNGEGKVTELKRIYSDVSDDVAEVVSPILRRIDFGPGAEAYVYYTLGFRRDPFEVLRVATDFEQEPPALVADVENRSTFQLAAVSVTVRVLGPEKAKPLRIYRRRFETAFAPGERKQLRVPVGAEWATARNTFLVSVRPALHEERETSESAQ
jgi:hypothetical protein